MYLASFIDSTQKDSVTCSNTAVSNASLPQQNPLSDTKNITSAEFPKGHQILLGAGSEHIYLHQKYTAVLKQGLTAELAKAGLMHK